MWWNIAVGASMLISAVTQVTNTIFGIVKDCTTDDTKPPEEAKPYSVQRYSGNYHNIRVSKYPSRTTINY